MPKPTSGRSRKSERSSRSPDSAADLTKRFIFHGIWTENNRQIARMWRGMVSGGIVFDDVPEARERGLRLLPEGALDRDGNPIHPSLLNLPRYDK